MTYEALQKANATIKTTNIKGKEYAEVNQRIKAFRMLYPDGTIETNMISNEGGVCIMRAVVKYYDATLNREIVLATGTAYEKENSSNINKTSYIENCETSAVGRALGIAGFGIDTSVASAEEVTNAVEQQEIEAVKNKLIDEPKIAALKNKLDEAGVPVAVVLRLYKVDSLSDLTVNKWKNAIEHIEDMKNA